MATRYRGLYPAGAFALVLVGTVLFLLSRELGPLGQGTDRDAPGDWVCLTDPESSSSFHSFQHGQTLGPFADRELPRLAGRLAGRCREIPLEAGTEIRLAGGPASGERDCAVSLMPERYRYLLGMPLNVNRAATEELELLPGIGPSLAARIVEVRASIGRFSSPRELLRVPGIGRKVLGKIEGRISF